MGYHPRHEGLRWNRRESMIHAVAQRSTVWTVDQMRELSDGFILYLFGRYVKKGK